MSPTWELLDKIGIAMGIAIGAAEVAQWVYLFQMSEDLEDIQEDIEDIEEEIDEHYEN